MEQAQYCMWMKRKHILTLHSQAPMNDSWEEQAFAEDASGPLGGCIWPPRSYSCSFCRREFKSAQALGGHMNVHRRDRARLKQSVGLHDEVDHQNQDQNPHISLGAQYPPQIGTLDNSHDPSRKPTFVASTLSPSRVSASTTQENFSDQHNFATPYNSSSILQENHKRSLSSTPPSWTESVAVRLLSISGSKAEEAKDPGKEESICIGHNDCVDTHLSLGLNLVVCGNIEPTRSEGDEVISCKKQKTAVSSLPFFLKPCLIQADVHGFKSSSIEELDLELRLASTSKVK